MSLKGFKDICEKKNPKFKKLQKMVQEYSKRFIHYEPYLKEFRANNDYKAYKLFIYHVKLFKIAFVEILKQENKKSMRKRVSYCSFNDFNLLPKYIKIHGRINYSEKMEFQQILITKKC